MDNATFKHLMTWIGHQFNCPDKEQAELTAKMVAQYDIDPELYSSTGWWRVYGDGPGLDAQY